MIPKNMKPNFTHRADKWKYTICRTNSKEIRKSYQGRQLNYKRNVPQFEREDTPKPEAIDRVRNNEYEAVYNAYTVSHMEKERNEKSIKGNNKKQKTTESISPHYSKSA